LAVLTGSANCARYHDDAALVDIPILERFSPSGTNKLLHEWLYSPRFDFHLLHRFIFEFVATEGNPFRHRKSQ
jgi:hypothetical protein